jgi:gluconolactonase
MNMLRLAPLISLVLVAPVFAADSPVLAPGAKLEKLGGGYEFTEGPAADKAGNIYFTDQPNDRIVRWDAATGAFTDWMKPAGRANGTHFDHAGNLIACADDKNELWSIAPDQKVTVLVKDFGGKLLNGPNDVWICPDNALYFSDPLYPRPYWKRDPATQQPGQFVYFLSADHRTLKPVATDLKQPNGLVGTPDGKTLYVADIGANLTYAYAIQPDGMLKDKRLFCRLGSDGMTLDSEGNVYLTGRGVTVFDRTGRQIEHLDVAEPWTANIRIGGTNHDFLFVTASQNVYGAKLRVKAAE